MKNGFTLTELLAVIVILSILVIVAVPAYSNMANSVKKSNLESTKKMVASTMLAYANKNYIDEIKPSGDKCNNNSCYKCYSIEFIVNKKIFSTAKDKGIINPETGKDLEGFIQVSYNTEKYQLEADYITTCDNAHIVNDA